MELELIQTLGFPIVAFLLMYKMVVDQNAMIREHMKNELEVMIKMRESIEQLTSRITVNNFQQK